MIEDSLSLTTPALLFPAISLLLLAYTNRFLTLAQLLRSLRRQVRRDDTPQNIEGQLSNLKFRVQLIRWMQSLGVMSFLACTATMLLIYWGFAAAGDLAFGVALLTLCASLIFSLWEIHISVGAINLELDGIERANKH